MSELDSKRRKYDEKDSFSLTDKLIEEYGQNGYLVLRNFFSSDEVEATKKEISRVIDDWYAEFERTGKEGPDWEEVVNRDPLVVAGQLKPVDHLHAVRRLFRISVHVDFFKELARHPKVIE